MHIAISTWLVYLCPLYHCLSQDTVYSPSTLNPLGNRDSIDGSDYRIDVYTDNKRFVLNEPQNTLVSLGLRSWGPVMFSALLREYPPSSSSYSDPICVPLTERVKYSIRERVSVSRAESIFDYDFAEDYIYVLSSTFEIRAVQIINNDTNIVKLLNLQWRISTFGEFVKNATGDYFTEAGVGLHRATKSMYIPTDKGLFRINVERPAISHVAKDVFQPQNGITFTDSFDKFLLVAYLNEGIYFYNVEDPNNISFAGKIDRTYWKLNEGDTFNIKTFFLQSTYVEVHGVSGSKANYSTSGDIETIFPSMTYQEREESLELDNLDFHGLFIAESRGVYVVDLTRLVNERVLPDALLPPIIPIRGIKSLARHHSTLYILKSYSEEDGVIPKNSDGVTYVDQATEIIMLNGKIAKWSDPSTKFEELFQINRQVDFVTKMDTMFVDETYYYVIGSETHFVEQRGIPNEYKITSARVGNLKDEPNISGFLKFILNGIPMLMSFSPTSVTVLDLAINDPTLRFSARDWNKFPSGDYVIEINGTSRSCPKKEAIRRSRNATTTPLSLQMCVWKQNVTFVLMRKPEVENGGSGGFNWLAIVMIVASVLFLLCVSLTIWRYNRCRFCTNSKRKTEEAKTEESQLMKSSKPKSNQKSRVSRSYERAPTTHLN